MYQRVYSKKSPSHRCHPMPSLSERLSASCGSFHSLSVKCEVERVGFHGVRAESCCHRLPSILPVQYCFEEVTLPHLSGEIGGGHYALSSPSQAIRSPPAVFSHNMVSYQKENAE